LRETSRNFAVKIYLNRKERKVSRKVRKEAMVLFFIFVQSRFLKQYFILRF
jgi:hypothetical protein